MLKTLLAIETTEVTSLEDRAAIINDTIDKMDIPEAHAAEEALPAATNTEDNVEIIKQPSAGTEVPG